MIKLSYIKRILDGLFVINSILQLLIVFHLVDNYPNKKIPVHFGIEGGSANSFGKITELFEIVGIVVFLYIFVIWTLNYSMKKELKDPKINKDSNFITIYLKRKIFTRIIIFYCSILLSFALFRLYDLLKSNVKDYVISSNWILIGFFLLTSIVIIGLVWVNYNNKKE